MTSDHDLVIDREVRNWVLLPLTVSVFLLLLLRQFASVFLGGGSQSKSPSSQQTSEEAAKEARQKAIIGRCQTMKASSCMITPLGFQQRIQYFTDKEHGVLHEEIEKKDMAEMMMTNPDMMSGMMKQQLGGLGPQLALGAFVNYFFRGFILGKLPFSLSPKFRGMLQSGIDLPSLDVTYLSSLSYYMLLLFGSRGILTLFFKDVVNDAAMAAQMQQKGMMMNPAAADPKKQFADEAKVMDLLQHRWNMEHVEKRAANVLRKT
ncbi:hypothetical protein M9434_003207 [Picochlorum sp. BPE23]|nr:hypothetical protein M9434_003207 [Picochlorum sp. BPE23]KAI8105248.1 hypothetical protein M9435_000416 [Picochlorum sp. BPE23]